MAGGLPFLDVLQPRSFTHTSVNVPVCLSLHASLRMPANMGMCISVHVSVHVHMLHTCLRTCVST